ncbi:MAG: polysaccharide deacetylase family protein [Candidatus Bathyarchaeia archaeon]
MVDICLIFEVHQPLRLNRNFKMEILARGNIDIKDLYKIYFDEKVNRDIFLRVCEKCYLPASKIILEQIDRFKMDRNKFKVSFSLSGVFLEQCEMWSPDLLDIFKQMVKTGCVELLCQTYYHSLSSLNPIDRSEFLEQIEMHRETIKELFGYMPETFENTECIYNNEIAEKVGSLGFKAIVTEGADRILGWRSPNFIYRAKNSPIKVLLRHYKLSDDIGFRFASTQWDQWPLTADKYASWLAHTPGQVLVLFLDYETFGEHYWAESGILEFLRWLPIEVCKWENLRWATPSEVIKKYAPCGVIDVPVERTVSWADAERDTSAWLSNPQQRISFNLLNEIGLLVKGLNNRDLLKIWRYLQISDHFYYMYTGGGESGIVHDSFNPYGNPIEAFIAYIGVLLDFEARCKAEICKPEFKHLQLLKRVPADREFKFFYMFASPTGITAGSLQEFYEALKKVGIESVDFHMKRGDFERWIANVIGDVELATRIGNLPKDWANKEDLRQTLLALLEERLRELKKNYVKNISQIEQ